MHALSPCQEPVLIPWSSRQSHLTTATPVCDTLCNGRQERQSLQAAFQNCSRQCPNYSRTMQQSRGITTNSWWLPGASPTRSQKVSEPEDRQSHSHGTRCLRRNVNQKLLLHGKTRENQNPPQSLKSPSIRDSQPSHTISRSKPFCTLSISATHPAQRSSPEGSLVHALDAEHLRTLHC